MEWWRRRLNTEPMSHKGKLPRNSGFETWECPRRVVALWPLSTHLLCTKNRGRVPGSGEQEAGSEQPRQRHADQKALSLWGNPAVRALTPHPALPGHRRDHMCILLPAGGRCCLLGPVRELHGEQALLPALELSPFTWGIWWGFLTVSQFGWKMEQDRERH